MGGAMDGRSIPGFYWDPEKKKYFKILSTHQGPRPESKYFKDNLEDAERALKKRKRAAARQKKVDKERVQRAPLRSWVGGLCLNRELGHYESTTRQKDARGDAAVTGFDARVVTLPSSNTSHILHFDVDPVTKILYTASADGVVVSYRPKSDISFDSIRPERHGSSELLRGTDLGTWASADERLHHRGRHLRNPLKTLETEPSLKKFGHAKPLHCLTTQISSLNICAKGRTLVTTSLGDHRTPSVHLASLDGTFGDTKFEPTDSATIWKAITSPASNDFASTIAVACSASVRMLALLPSGSWELIADFESTNDKSTNDTRALAYMSPTLLATGNLKGYVRLYDTRSGKGSKVCLKHTSAIFELRHADNSMGLVVAGGSGSLTLYDLRMQHNPKRDGRRKPWKIPSLPVFDFDHSGDPRGLCRGLDVHKQLSLLAAGADNGDIGLYSMQTGEMLNSFENGRSGQECIRFVNDEYDVPKIMTTRGKDIVELAW